MMIIDSYTKNPNFPFDRYFEDTNEYIFAMQYWNEVLKSVPNFTEPDWQPRRRPVELESDMYLGKVIDIISTTLKKEINLQTLSIAGDTNVFLKENGGYTEEEYREQKELFGEDFHLDDQALKGMSYEEALRSAQEASRKSPLMAWVEKGIHWQPDPKHPEGGYEMDIERLILTSEISERAEPKAIQALDIFLQPGPAMDRVNSIFASD